MLKAHGFSSSLYRFFSQKNDLVPWLFKAVITAIKGLNIFKVNLCLSRVNTIFKKKEKGEIKTLIFFNAILINLNFWTL